MRPLTRAVRRRNDNYVSQRPAIPDDPDLAEVEKRDKANFNEHFKGHLRFYSQGQSIFTEGTLVAWDVDLPEMYKLQLHEFLDENNDIIQYTVLG